MNSPSPRLCIVMVGLPARGKSLIARKLMRYFNWISMRVRIFNVGVYRRRLVPYPAAEFFDQSNKLGEQQRKLAAHTALTDMLHWFAHDSGEIAIFDATNTTKERRRWIYQLCSHNSIDTLFVESCCNNRDLVEKNILDVKLASPDYPVNQDPDKIVADFQERIRKYESVYSTIDNEEDTYLSYVKLIDVNHQIVINLITDYLQSRVVYFLMNLHTQPRSVWLSRHGESLFNLSGKIGGDSDLSQRGHAYARALPHLLQQSVGNRVLTVWTSTLKRTIQTAKYLPYKKLSWKALDELDSGVCDGLTYAQIEKLYPDDFRTRDNDKYNYRYLGGESYRDVVIRLEPIIMELERSENILIVTHQAILRCIYAYFMNVPQEQSPWMEVPLHTLICLTPKAYGTEEKRFAASIPAVSTWRSKGSTTLHATPSPPCQKLSPSLA